MYNRLEDLFVIGLFLTSIESALSYISYSFDFTTLKLCLFLYPTKID